MFEILALHHAIVAKHGWPDHRVRDLAALDDALQVPKYFWLEGVTVPVKLAKTLTDAIRRAQPFMCASDATAFAAQALFRQRNGASTWIEIAAGCGS